MRNAPEEIIHRVCIDDRANADLIAGIFRHHDDHTAPLQLKNEVFPYLSADTPAFNAIDHSGSVKRMGNAISDLETHRDPPVFSGGTSER